MRILYSHHAFTLQSSGGVSRYFAELIGHLQTFPDIATRVVAPLFRNLYLTDSRPQGLIGLRVPQIRRTGLALRLLNGFVERGWTVLERPDLVHPTHYALPPQRPGIPTVITVYDMIHELFPENVPTAAAESAAKRRAVERADHIICISETTRRDLVALFGVDERRISVTHLGSSLGTSHASSAAPSEAPCVLFVGRRDGYKNFGRLLEAFSRCSEAHDHRLVCFGGGAFTAEERALFARLRLDGSRIAQVGGSDAALAGWYRHATVLAVPSLYEGFGLPALEAMTLGCPVVCSSGGSLPEVVGDAALLFDPEDVEQMTAVLDHVLGDPTLAAELSERGKQRSLAFSWSDCAEKTLAVYRALVD